jgi:stage V sporulation protein AE
VEVLRLEPPVRVILVTDGDKVARRAVEEAAQRLGLRCISASAGNPTPFSGPELAELVLQAVHDPVVVMLDDKGDPGRGPGEQAMAYLCKHPDLQVLGAVACASNTKRARGIRVDASVTRDGRLVSGPVDKDGYPCARRGVLKGDTVDVLRDLKVPVVIGIGDPGKMEGADCREKGSEVTVRAIEEILKRTVGASD